MAIERWRPRKELRRWDPFRDFDEFFEGWPRWWNWPRMVLARREWTPALDMFDQEDKLVIRAELPGMDKVNINGGGIALGHPIGASGARVLVSLMYAMKAHGKKLGCASLCLGGGNAVAMIIEAA